MGIQPLANHSELTPLRFLQRSVEVYPSKDAVIHGARTYSYAQFGAAVQRFAKALAAHIKPSGQRPNCGQNPGPGAIASDAGVTLGQVTAFL